MKIPIYSNKLLLKISIYYFSIYTILILIRVLSNYCLTSNLLNSISLLGLWLLPAIPMLWFSYIKRAWLKTTIMIGYGIILCPLSFASIISLGFILHDIISNNDNGFRPVFKKQIDTHWLIIYRTPDQGALGGDHIQPAIVDKICPGIERRKWLKETDIINDNSNDSNYVMIGTVKYMIPKEDVLRQSGNLK